MNFIISAATDVGTTKATNQDSFSTKVFNTVQGEMAFAVLCDGMGGLDKGEVASASVVNAYNKWANEKLPLLCKRGITDSEIREDWGNIAVECNEKIKRYGKLRAVSLGTTLTAMLITSSRYYIINVGDTRAYEIIYSATALTSDQTVVAREVAMGNITQEEALTDSRRSVLLQCIGASDAVYPDMLFGETVQNAVYMLCSDGFRHEITENEIYHFLNANVMNDAQGMKKNIESLISINKQRQERDNITAVAIRTF